MSNHRFRRPKKRWQLAGSLAAILLLATQFRQAPDSQRLDTLNSSVAAGKYSVTEVATDGSLEVIVPTENGDRLATVSLLGVALADQAAAGAFLRERIRNNFVRLRFDRRRINEAGTLQAYVFVDEDLLNEELVWDGLATEDTHPSDSGPMIRRLKKAEQAAREQKRGVWRESLKTD